MSLRVCRDLRMRDEVVGAEVLVGGCPGEDVPDGDEDRVLDGDERVSCPGGQPGAGTGQRGRCPSSGQLPRQRYGGLP